ncbi:ankyrin repeat domain-containing protein [Tahibacter sp.]|uniref:ankyrin repeat domain-containing protein n=1 Tax=Tahibacter sp. TaxID=2056211 RepID=UPI0028C42A95|nr:ankyrin repeat domain-containing protein [Tahibacter sp.]
MPRAKPTRLAAFVASLPYFLPAALCLLIVAFVVHPAVLLLLLAANSLTLAAICHGLGFDQEDSFARTVLRRGAAHFVVLATYTAAVMLLLGWPLAWLLQGGSLPATMCLSAAVVVALLLLWRLWPAFGLVLVWDDAYPDDEQGSWILTAVSRSVSFARHLTGEHELFFSHGLPVALAQLVMVCLAVGIAGLGQGLPTELRTLLLLIYVAALPLAQLLVANRCLRALLTARRARYAQTPAIRTDPAVGDCALPRELPTGLAPAELDAALLHATRCGQVELALAALERGADPNTVPGAGERDQRSVLMLATTLPEVRLLRALIAKRADVNRVHAGLSPLLAATRDSYQGRPDAVLTLLANGADPAIGDARGNTALHYAALAAEPIVAAMLIDAGAPLAAINRDGLTPLGQAAHAANWTLLRFLLEHGARNEVEHAQPALSAAAAIADDDMTGVKLLLKQKARVDAQGPLGRTALMAAALSGHAAIARCLLDAGASVDLSDSHATTALMEAARAGAAEVIALLAARKPDPNRVDHLGRSALAIACQSRQANATVVRALLALGIDRHRPCTDGRRALDHAIAGGRWDLVALIDPDYALPSSVAESAGSAVADSPAHLLDALRFGHWTIAEGLLPRLGQWSQADLAGIWLELATHSDARPRQWLLNHGLRADAFTTRSSLFSAALERLPDAAAAVAELVQAGANSGGAGVLRRVLEAARGVSDATRREQLLALALDLAQRGADAFAVNEQGESATHLAAQLGAATLLDRLLDGGANPNARDQAGRTPLHAALGLPPAQLDGVVQSLIRHGADPELASNDGETALGRALGGGGKSLQYWLHWPKWPLPRRRLRAEDLVAAAACGDTAAVDRLLTLGLPLEGTDAQGATALLRSCGHGHGDVVRLLLSRGADVEHAAAGGATCLSAAASARRDGIVDLLLAHGAALDRSLPGGGTTLMIAAALGFPELVEKLLASGADANVADEKGSTALHAAAHYAFSHAGTRARAVLEVLLRLGAAPNARNAKGQTALLLLVGGRADPGSPCDPAQLAHLVALLLDFAADLDAQDERGVSALHACAIHGLLGCARQLLARGAERDIRDRLGRRPADLAELLGHVDVAAELGSSTAIPSLAQMLRQPANHG